MFSSFELYFPKFKFSNSGYHLTATAAYAPLFTVHVLHIITIVCDIALITKHVFRVLPHGATQWGHKKLIEMLH